MRSASRSVASIVSDIPTISSTTAASAASSRGNRRQRVVEVGEQVLAGAPQRGRGQVLGDEPLERLAPGRLRR